MTPNECESGENEWRMEETRCEMRANKLQLMRINREAADESRLNGRKTTKFDLAIDAFSH